MGRKLLWKYRWSKDFLLVLKQGRNILLKELGPDFNFISGGSHSSEVINSYERNWNIPSHYFNAQIPDETIVEMPGEPAPK